jgi:ribosomal protein S18
MDFTLWQWNYNKTQHKISHNAQIKPHKATQTIKGTQHNRTKAIRPRRHVGL